LPAGAQKRVAAIRLRLSNAGALNLSALRPGTIGLLLAATVVTPTFLTAEVMLASPFTDHAVLQRDIAVPVWGQAAPGEKIAVHFRGHTLATTAAADGRWSVRLAPMPASAEGAELTVSGSATVTLHDVVVGEVWLASGQSNIEWPLNLSRNGAAAVAGANSPLIRHLKIERSPSDQPTTTVKTGGWQTATPQTAGGFSAIGYFFAQELTQKLGIPVGLINSSWGGTPIESWLAEPVLRTTKGWPRFDKQWQEALKVFPQKLAEYPALDAAWQKADTEARASGKPNPLPWPQPPVGPGTAYAPGGLFNGMIMPLAPYALRGVLWYQGESNIDHVPDYPELFVAMIRDWRARWAQGDLPFYFVQIPNYADGDAPGRKWAQLREAQTRALALPNTAMAVTIDVGDTENIHPTNKQPVGERLAFLAEAKLYGLAVEWSGPEFRSASGEGSALRVKFTHAKGLTPKVTPASGFEVAGVDRVFHSAIAQIENETVVVSSPDVPEPVAVRYAWTNGPVASLYNGAGLPAAPFRSDNW
jgi:sialate O-acetylesterase